LCQAFWAATAQSGRRAAATVVRWRRVGAMTTSAGREEERSRGQGQLRGIDQKGERRIER